MDLFLKDKVAVITGAAKGVGGEITRALYNEGCKLILLGRDESAIATLCDSIGIIDDCMVMTCDIRNDKIVDDAIANGMKRFGRIDILVNVAGIAGPVGKPLWEIQAEEYNNIFDTNTKGCFNLIRAVSPIMIKQRYGKIINIGGTFGIHGKAGRSIYSSSKWALRGITKSSAIELGKYNINVNYIAPGMIAGRRFNEEVCESTAKEAGRTIDDIANDWAKSYALQRITEGNDVANCVLFLASDRSRQITGCDIIVDGGWASL